MSNYYPVDGHCCWKSKVRLQNMHKTKRRVEDLDTRPSKSPVETLS